jgi:hypothetical protein
MLEMIHDCNVSFYVMVIFGSRCYDTLSACNAAQLNALSLMSTQRPMVQGVL